MSKLLLSSVDTQVIEYLQQKNELLFSEKIDKLLSYEQNHTDMQCLIIEDTAYVLSECNHLIDDLKKYYKTVKIKEKIRISYPNNILLNCLAINNCLIGKIDFIAKEVVEYCNIKNFKLINVNQGYTKCSTCVVNNNSIITEDESISNVLQRNNFDVLKIRKGFVHLEGAEYGFIGGASGLISNDTLFFTGDITKHPDYEKINKFCLERNIKISYIENKTLEDIGGIILLKN